MLRLYFFDIGKYIDTMVDTGFTMDLLVDDIDFVARAGFKSKNVVRSGTLASRLMQTFMVWETEIEWFGHRRVVEVDVPAFDGATHEHVSEPTERKIIPVLGTKLLNLCRLEIDFAEQTLAIKKVAL
jgi:hypothetical protein